MQGYLIMLCSNPRNAKAITPANHVPAIIHEPVDVVTVFLAAVEAAGACVVRFCTGCCDIEGLLLVPGDSAGASEADGIVDTENMLDSD